MNRLLEKYPELVQHILSKYPPDQKRAATMPLIYLAQREKGFVNKIDLAEIGEIVGISDTDVASLVGFYSLYHDLPEGKYRIQVCHDLPCALRGAEAYLEQLCDRLGIEIGGTTPDGLVTVEAVMCLAACDKAPMFQVQTGEGLEYHENQTVESTLELIEKWRAAQSAQESPPEKLFEAPILPTVEHGISSLTREERVRIMETRAQ